ncbi:HEAT repeat domain-containing protein [Geotalea toluenoxydans]
MDRLQILIEALHSADEEKRRLAVVGFRDYPLDQTLDSLFLALGDTSWRVRKEAVDIIVVAAEGENAGNLQEELVNMLRSQDNAGLRNSAVESLEKLGKKASKVLCLHIADEDHDVRKFIIDIMGNIGDPAFVPALINALDDPDANARAAAAENLGKIQDVRALPELLEALAKSDVLLKFTILEAVGKIGQPVPVSAIAPLANDNLLKKAVYDCLGAIGDLDAIPLLVEGLKDRQKKAREAAATGLVALRKRLSSSSGEEIMDNKLEQLKGTSHVDDLIDSFNNAENSLKEAFAILLGVIGDARAAKPLLLGCNDDRLRRLCLQALRKIGNAAAASLLEVFPSAEDDQRCFIVYLCGELGCKESVSLLTEGMLDLNPQLRLASVKAAGKTGLTVFVNEVAHLLEDNETEVRNGAIEALYRLAETDRISVARIAGKLASSDLAEKRRNAAVLCTALADTERLSLLVKDEDATVRKAAVSSLASLKSVASAGHLVMALVDEDPDVRIAAAGALGDVGSEEVVGPLLLALQDDDPWVQCAVLKSLGNLKNEATLPAIVQLFERADGLVLITALDAVAKIGGETARALVEKALDNSDEEVVKAAIGILTRENDAWVHTHRDKLLNHSHWDVRSTFIKAMVSRLGEKSFPYLRQALQTETDELVKGQIIELMDRVL